MVEILFIDGPDDYAANDFERSPHTTKDVADICRKSEDMYTEVEGDDYFFRAKLIQYPDIEYNKDFLKFYKMLYNNGLIDNDYSKHQDIFIVDPDDFPNPFYKIQISYHKNEQEKVAQTSVKVPDDSFNELKELFKIDAIEMAFEILNKEIQEKTGKLQ